MKKIMILIAAVAAGAIAGAQTCETGGCSCASCEAKESDTFTLAGLKGLNEHGAAVDQADALDHDGDGVADHETHEDHDHAEPAEEAAHAGCSHDHAAVDPHAGHDHGDAEEGGLELSEAMQQQVGIQIQEARGGRVSRTSVFPAEIKLNRDRAAAVSPRYASIVRQVFAEIGDEVHKGDILASLENRETMAVYSVSAPQDGVIISKDLAVGETASEERVLYQVADLSSVWADISIFPQYQHLLEKGMPVELIAHDGHAAVGTIKYISPIVSEQTRTFTARCILKGALDDFTPGAFVRARITVDSVESAVVVPPEAVQVLEGERVVFMPGEHGFISAPVKTGLEDASGVEIKSGLKPGDRYVSAGAFALKAQMVTSGMDPHAGHGH